MSKRKGKKKVVARKKKQASRNGPRKETPNAQRSITDQDGRQVLIAFGRERFFPHEAIEEGDYVCYTDGRLEAVANKKCDWCDPFTGVELQYDPLREEEETPAGIEVAEFNPATGTYEPVEKTERGTGGKGGWAGYKNWRSKKGEKQRKKTEPKERMVIKVAGTNEVYDTAWYKDLFDELKKKVPYETATDKGETFYWFTFPREQLGFKKAGYRQVAVCGYNGTNGFLGHLLGVQLDRDDEDWYKGHVSTDRHGILLTWIPTVLDQLVEPYGIGVSRIRFKKGEYADYVDFAAWRASLGVNPLAIAEGPTKTNEDWAAVSGLPIEEVDAEYRIDFGPRPFQPCTVACVYAGGDFGHVSYGGPRTVVPPHWQIAVQFARRDTILYHVPLELTPYQGKDDEYEIDWLETRDKDGNLYVERYQNKGARKGSTIVGPGWDVQPASGRSGAQSSTQIGFYGDAWD